MIGILDTKGHVSITKKLIEVRCNIDLQQSDGYTTSCMTGVNGHVSVAEQMIELVGTLIFRRRMMGTRGPIRLLKMNVVVNVNQILRDGHMSILDHDVDRCVNQSFS